MKPLLFCTLFSCFEDHFHHVFMDSYLMYLLTWIMAALYENLLIPVKPVKKAIFHEMILKNIDWLLKLLNWP